jgi:hypothetical protein
MGSCCTQANLVSLPRAEHAPQKFRCTSCGRTVKRSGADDQFNRRSFTAQQRKALAQAQSQMNWRKVEPK